MNQDYIYSQWESERLSESKSCDYRDLIFIKIFNGYFPLPSRYYLRNSINEGHSFTSFSRPFHIPNKLDINPEKIVLGGTIVSGELNAIYTAFVDIDDENMVENSKELYTNGLRVRIYSNTKRFGSNSFVIIDDDSEALMIMDPNPDLWRLLTGIYQNIKDGCL
ncbi:MAG: hypothetical protein JXA04_01065 [Gammaproteobacteria bacterium]|nr:hypothetical protein [Gammaproteobacteria bacterium]